MPRVLAWNWMSIITAWMAGRADAAERNRKVPGRCARLLASEWVVVMWALPRPGDHPRLRDGGRPAGWPMPLHTGLLSRPGRLGPGAPPASGSLVA